MIPATKTLAAINAALEYDQGARFRELERINLPLIEDAYRGKEDNRRNHLGASILGQDCHRSTWYTYRWATEKTFDGRLLRLFNRGHLEEARFISLLQMIGVQVWSIDEATKKQIRISGEDNHFGGSLDAVLVGIPDLPEGVPCLGEFKTHNDKSFKYLVANGLLQAKWAHYIQMQVYMGKLGLSYGLYCAVNKNDDEIYLTLVPFAPVDYQNAIDLAHKIVWSTDPPQKISNNPSWYKCSYCDHKQLCHYKEVPSPSCRTCRFSRPGTLAEGAEGRWHCGNRLSLKYGFIDEIAQKEMCTHYEYADWVNDTP